MKVQLLTFPGCPNADPARAVLHRVLAACGLSPDFEETDIATGDVPEALRGWGSPTILVDGQDVTGAQASGTGSACRLYFGSGTENRGVPPEGLIQAALLRRHRPGRQRFARSLVLLPGPLVALLPSVTCPLCLPAWAGVLSSLGLGFVMSERVLAPVIALLLTVGCASVAWSARCHRRVAPLALALVGSAAVVAGRLVWSIPVVTYAGAALLVGASVWNLWLKRPRGALVPLRVGRRDAVP
jgi:hypothetical protein